MNNIPKTNLLERYPWNQSWFAFALGGIFAALDFTTGPYIQLPILFIIPVVLMAWTNGLRLAVILAVVLCLVRFSFSFLWTVPWTIWDAAINLTMRSSVLVFMAFITAKNADHTRRLEKQTEMLEGVLPICAWCKDIRDENGQWQKMEKYVSNHSNALFSHGVCPKCKMNFLDGASHSANGPRLVPAVGLA